MAKAPASRKTKRSDATNKLLEALNSIEYTTDDNGRVFEQFCRIKDNRVIGTNGKLTVCIPVECPFNANVSTTELIMALKQTGDQVSFTELPNYKGLVVASGKFGASVQVVIGELLPTINPDLPVAKVSNDLLEALSICAEFADEKSDVPAFAGVLMDGYCCAATDRHTIVQFWHGIHLPKGLIIPKPHIKALLSRDAPLTEFGFSEQTATFYYADGTWITTSLMDGRFPNYETVLDRPSNQQAIPPDFWTGLRSILDFADGGTILFRDASLETHDGNKGAKYDVPGINKNGGCFNGKRLIVLEKYATTIDFYHPNGAMFVGKRMRGIVARRM